MQNNDNLQDTKAEIDFAFIPKLFVPEAEALFRKIEALKKEQVSLNKKIEDFQKVCIHPAEDLLGIGSPGYHSFCPHCHAGLNFGTRSSDGSPQIIPIDSVTVNALMQRWLNKTGNTVVNG